MNKNIRNEFIKLAKEGPVHIENLFFSVRKLNDSNFNMNDKFKKQLIDENLYDNSYIGIITPNENGPFNMEWLPVYGNRNLYVTRHFQSSVDKAINACLRDKDMCLLERYAEPL